jgi:hypothetical protein
MTTSTTYRPDRLLRALDVQGQTGFLCRVSDAFLWRLVDRNGHTWQARALDELERRALVAARNAYFSRNVPTKPIAAGDLTQGNVITEGRGGVRMVIRDVYRLPQSDRVLVAFSYTNLSNGEVDEVVHELPVMASDREVRLVRESVPDFTALAVIA